MNYYHGKINTPFERYIDIYIEGTDYQYAEWRAWDEAKSYGRMVFGIYFTAERGADYDEQEFIDGCEGWIVDQITYEEYRAAMMRGELCV